MDRVRSVEDYVAQVPEPARTRLSQLRAAIRSSVPRGATEIISYRMPAFKHGRVLVWYGAFTNHVSLFPGGAVLGRFEGDLADFTTRKGTVQFPLDRRLPIALIKRIVRARVAESAAAKKRR
jgi:uncharacterized protein YdhG (YjbR/CyaY superfamily)